MKKTLILPTTLAALSFLGGSMLTSCSSEEEQTAALSAAAVAEREEAFPALAYLSQNVDNFIAINVKNTLNVIDVFTEKETSKKINKSLAQMDPSIGSILKNLESAAIGIPTADSSTVKDLFNLIPSILQGRIVADASESQLHIEPLLNSAIVSLNKLKPVYLAITFSDEETAKQANTLLQAAAIRGIQQANLPATSFEKNSWKGYKMNLGELANMAGNNENIHILAKTNTYLVSRQEDNAIILAFCTNPSDLAIPSNASSSALVSSGANILQESTGTNTLAVASISEGTIQNLLTAASDTTESCVTILRQTSLINSQLEKAIKGIIKELKPLTNRDINHPLSALVWADDNVHLNVACDSLGASFTSAKVATKAPADAIVYAYGSTLSGYPKIDVAKLIASIVDSIKPNTDRTKKINKNGIAKDIQPIINNVNKIVDSLGNGWNFTIDYNAKRQSRLDWSDESAGYLYTPDERVAFSIQLKNRSAAEKAYQATINSLAKVITKYDTTVTKDEIIGTFDTNKATEGHITHHTFVEGESEDPTKFSAGYSITNSAVCLGAHRQLNTQSITSRADSSISGVHVTYNYKNAAITRAAAYLKNEKARLKYYQKQLEKEEASPQSGSYYSYMAPVEEARERVAHQQADVSWAQERLDKEKEFYNNYFSGAEADLTTDGGKLKLHIKAITPCLKRGK